MSADAPLVMVVEDDIDVRETLVETLEDHGYRVMSAVHGKDALDKLRASGAKPRALLLDIMMPVLDGWAFRREQLRDPELAAIPVIVLTAAGHAALKAPDTGATVLAKPVELNKLLETVAALSGRDGS